MTNDFKPVEEKQDAGPEGSRISDADMKKVQAAMQEDDEPAAAAARPEKAVMSDEELLAYVQQERERQRAEARADAAKLDAQAGPDNAEHGDHWEDRGIIDVPVADLPDPDDVNGPEDFDHHISYDDAVRATERLQEMRPLIAQGYTADDFAALDKQNGVDPLHGQERVYRLFYGSEPIKVDKDGDTYDIISGRHRIFVAKERGYEFIPAQVSERVRSS